MRILAYGGTGYETRKVLGNWESINRNILQATSGLERGLSFGCGWFSGEDPFIVIRQLQNVQNRGGYPYTFLIDPGLVCWERFSWNVALMVEALMENPSVLTSPEDIGGMGDLAELIETLTPPTRPITAAGDSLPLADLLVSQSFDAQPLNVRPGDLGLSENPTLEEVGGQIGALPACFRFGSGWLIGGNEKLASAFGGCLVIQEHPQNVRPQQLEQPFQHGRQVRRAFDRVLGSKHKESIEDISQSPVRTWKPEPPLDVRTCVDRIIMLCELLDGAHDSDRLKELRQSLPKIGKLAEELRKTYLEALSAGTTKIFDEGRTALIVEETINRNTSLSKEDSLRLQPHTVIDVLTRFNITPTKAANLLTLIPDVRFGIWSNLLKTQTDFQRLKNLLQEAVADLAGRAADLVETALERGRTLGVPNSSWLGIGVGEVLGDALKKGVRKIIVDSVASRHGNWESDFVLFAGDFSNDEMKRFKLAVEDFIEISEWCLLEIDYSGRQKAEARDWLIALAAEGIRSNLPLELKLRIADKVKARWAGLLTLKRLYDGFGDPVTTSTDSFLKKELQDLASSAPMNPGPPNISGLFSLLGDDLPNEFFKALIQRVSESKADGVLRNIKELREGGINDDITRRVAIRFLVGSAELSIAEALVAIGLVDSVLMTEFLESLLFDSEIGEHSRCRSRLTELLRSSLASELHIELLSEILPVALKQEANRKIFIVRFASDEAAMDLLAVKLSKEAMQEIATLLLQGDQKDLEHLRWALPSSLLRSGTGPENKTQTGSRPSLMCRFVSGIKIHFSGTSDSRQEGRPAETVTVAGLSAFRDCVIHCLEEFSANEKEKISKLLNLPDLNR